MAFETFQAGGRPTIMRNLTLVPLLLLLAAGPATKPATQPSNTDNILGDLRPHLEQFELRLHYLGPQDKPYYALTLSVPPLPKIDAVASELRAQITAEQAGKVLKALADSGALERMERLHRGPVKYEQPCYILRVGTAGKSQTYIGSLGFDRGTLKHLNPLREALEGDAARQMELLLARLGGHRAEWEKE